MTEKVVDLTRVKIVRIPIRTLVCFFHWQKDLPTCFMFPDLQLPEGFTIVRAAQVDYLSMSVYVVISHPSFEQVEECCTPPEFDPTYACRMYMLATPEELAARTKEKT